MKIRFARIKNLASIRMKGAGTAALLFLLAFALTGLGSAQDNPQSSPAKAGKAASAAGAITDIKTLPENTKLTVVVSTDRRLAPEKFLLEGPARLVIDFPNTENKVPFTQLPVHAVAIKKIRVQQFQSVPSPIARVVLDLEEGFGTHEMSVDKDSVRLVFYRDSKASASSVAAAPTAAPAVKKPAAAAQTVAPKPFKPAQAAPAIPAATAAAVPPAPVPKRPAPQPAAVKAAVPERSELARADESHASPVPDRKPAAAPRQVFPKVEMPVLNAAADPKPFSPPQAEVPARPAVTPSPAISPKMAASSSSKFSGQPLTLDLIDFPLVDFFRLMSEEGGINIVMDPEIKGRVSIKVVKVPWDQIFEAVLTNNGLDKQVDGTVVRIARKSTLQDEARQQESLKKATLLAADLETRIKRLNYAKATALAKALDDQKTVRGTIVVEDRSNSLILTDLPSSLNKLIQLIEVLDVPQPQVEIEARIVSATRDFARDIGVQFGFVDGNLQRVTVGGPNTFGTIGGTRPSATPTSTYSAGNGITGRGASEDTSSESAAVSTGTSSNSKGNYNVNLPATKAFGGLGISIGNIFDTFLLDAAITAGESKGNAKLISQPKVVAQNNSPAVVTQGLRFPVQVVANNTISVQFQNAALTLTVTPQITYEGNIVLDLKVENNTPDFSRQVNGVPSIRTSESTTRVLVTDGGTTVIGGILIDDEATQEDKVPGLGSLPIVGNLFRRNAVSRTTQEVLFFVTPRVIK